MNFTQILKRRKRYLWYCLAAMILSCLLFEMFSSYFTFAYTIKGQECFPYRFWFIRKGVIPRQGEYVYFRRTGTRWVKVLHGEEGDRIEVIKIPEKERFKIFINEIGKPLAVQGYVFV